MPDPTTNTESEDREWYEDLKRTPSDEEASAIMDDLLSEGKTGEPDDDPAHDGGESKEAETKPEAEGEGGVEAKPEEGAEDTDDQAADDPATPEDDAAVAKGDDEQADPEVLKFKLPDGREIHAKPEQLEALGLDPKQFEDLTTQANQVGHLQRLYGEKKEQLETLTTQVQQVQLAQQLAAQKAAEDAASGQEAEPNPFDRTGWDGNKYLEHAKETGTLKALKDAGIINEFAEEELGPFIAYAIDVVTNLTQLQQGIVSEGRKIAGSVVELEQFSNPIKLEMYARHEASMFSEVAGAGGHYAALAEPENQEKVKEHLANHVSTTGEDVKYTPTTIKMVWDHLHTPAALEASRRQAENEAAEAEQRKRRAATPDHGGESKGAPVPKKPDPEDDPNDVGVRDGWGADGGLRNPRNTASNAVG